MRVSTLMYLHRFNHFCRRRPLRGGLCLSRQSPAGDSGLALTGTKTRKARQARAPRGYHIGGATASYAGDRRRTRPADPWAGRWGRWSPLHAGIARCVPGLPSLSRVTALRRSGSRYRPLTGCGTAKQQGDARRRIILLCIRAARPLAGWCARAHYRELVPQPRGLAPCQPRVGGSGAGAVASVAGGWRRRCGSPRGARA